jgi:hypothetical protein
MRFPWQAAKVGATKQPFHIGMADGELFSFAGLRERRKEPAITADDALLHHAHDDAEPAPRADPQFQSIQLGRTRP